MPGSDRPFVVEPSSEADQPQRPAVPDIAALRELLQLPPSQRLEPERLLELLPHLVRFALQLDPAVWSAWQHVAPASSAQRPPALAHLLARLCAEEPGTPLNPLAEQLDQLRLLTQGLLAAASQQAHLVIQRHFARFAPAAIEALPNSALFGVMRDARRWRKYRDLVGAFNPARFESDVLQSMAEFVEGLMRDPADGAQPALQPQD